jgi:hypothetical protein
MLPNTVTADDIAEMLSALPKTPDRQWFVFAIGEHIGIVTAPRQDKLPFSVDALLMHDGAVIVHKYDALNALSFIAECALEENDYEWMYL